MARRPWHGAQCRARRAAPKQKRKQDAAAPGARRPELDTRLQNIQPTPSAKVFDQNAKSYPYPLKLGQIPALENTPTFKGEVHDFAREARNISQLSLEAGRIFEGRILAKFRG